MNSRNNVRLGFGYAKIKEAKILIEQYIKNGGEINAKPILMFADALQEYLKFHQGKYRDEHICEIENIYNELKCKISPHPIMGGYQVISKTTFSDEEIKIIENLFNKRHSIREFSHLPVDHSKLKKAIQLATCCPSACNRQGYRCYIISKEKIHLLDNWLDGIGGFSKDVDKFIMITGKISVYRKAEELQWVVTATVFASYLTISLEALGIGCCFIQRPIIPNEQQDSIFTKLNIPKDEQIVCVLGIGNLKDEYKVPISYRLPVEDILTEK